MLIANLIAWPAAYLTMQAWLGSFAYRVDTGLNLFLMAGVAALLIALLTVGYQAIRA